MFNVSFFIHLSYNCLNDSEVFMKLYSLYIVGFL